MIGITKMRDLRIIHTSEFSKDKKRHFASEDASPKDIAPQNYIQYANGKDNMTLYNSVKSQSNAAYMLGKK